MNTILERKISKFFDNDIINLKEHPDKEIADYFSAKYIYYIFDLSKIKNDVIKQELKELIILILKCKPRNRSSIHNYFKPLTYLINLISDSDANTIFEITDEKLNLFLQEHDIKIDRNNTAFMKKMQQMKLKESEKDMGLNKAIISYKDLNLSPARLNLTTTQDSMDFRTIHYKENSELLRTYIKYDIGLTDKSYSTIVQEFRFLRDFLNFIGDKPLVNIDMSIITDFIDYLNKKNITTMRFNNYLEIINLFLSLLFIKGLVPTSFNLKQYKRKSSYKYIRNRVDQYALLQIFKNLHKMKPHFLLMFLVIYTTGMRVSEACALTTDCLYNASIDGIERYFIRYNSEKMNGKSCMNMIPESLYNLIKTYMTQTEKTSVYLFPSERDLNLPYQTRTYSDAIKDYMAEWQIKNEDGTPYKYKAHSYRHELCSQLVDNNVPIYVISDVVHHYSPEMTLAYAEVSKKHKHDKYVEYFNKVGVPNACENSMDYKDADLLSNGQCIHPTHKCNHINACLTCENFKTDIRYLEQHKRHLTALQEKLKYYEANKFLPQAETAKRTISALEQIIKSLEENSEK